MFIKKEAKLRATALNNPGLQSPDTCFHGHGSQGAVAYVLDPSTFITVFNFLLINFYLFFWFYFICYFIFIYLLHLILIKCLKSEFLRIFFNKLKFCHCVCSFSLLLFWGTRADQFSSDKGWCYVFRPKIIVFIESVGVIFQSSHESYFKRPIYGASLKQDSFILSCN